MKKSQKITIISSISAIALVAAAVISYPYIFKDSPIQSIDNTSSIVSSAPSSPSSEVSSSIVVPEIETPVSSETPAVSSAPTEIKVEGSPTSKPSGTSSTVSKPKDTTPKPTTQVSSTPTAKPTGNGDVYDPLTGTYPKIGDTTTHPIDGAPLTWTGTAWMAEDDGGKSGVAADTKPDDWYLGNPDNNIGAD